MSKYNWNLDEIENAVKLSNNYSEVLRILQIPGRGRNVDTLKRRIEKYNIDISHFNGRDYRKSNNSSYISVNEYLGTDKYIHTTKLRDKLLKEGFKENRRECCGITEWNGQEITMQLHHVNGNHLDNRLENLQMLCPNCHSQTDNYCGNANEKEKSFCPDCGTEKHKNSRYCKNCAQKHRSIITVDVEQLLKDKEVLKTNIAIAKKYNVSETAIRKRLKNIKK